MVRERDYCFREVLPFVALVSVECTSVGTNTLYKAAVSKGLSYHVYMAYSYAIAAILVLPLAFYFHRNTPLPPISFTLIGKFFILGFLGFSGQYCGNLGIKYSSPTMGSAMSNVAPACTFFLAIIFRMEKLKLRSLSSQAKLMGALVSIAGALIVVLYNGQLLIPGDAEHLRSPTRFIKLPTLSDARSNWILGGALNAACYAIAAVLYIFQSKVIREYPAELVIVFVYNFFALVFALPVGIATDPHLSSWKFPADVRMWAILYSGIIGTGYGIMVHTWGLHVKGPVYVALFKPLSIAIAAILGVIFLGDNLYLGTVIGSAVITIGFYSVLWGKHKEEESDTSSENEETFTIDHVDVPLLKDHKHSSA